jgi:hypothetical protein
VQFSYPDFGTGSQLKHQNNPLSKKGLERELGFHYGVTAIRRYWEEPIVIGKKRWISCLLCQWFIIYSIRLLWADADARCYYYDVINKDKKENWHGLEYEIWQN